MTGIIDRFEGEFAVVELENMKMLNIEKNKLPKEVKEGYVINIENEITIDYIETDKRKNKIEELTKDLWK
jgi:transcription elongation factor